MTALYVMISIATTTSDRWPDRGCEASAGFPEAPGPHIGVAPSAYSRVTFPTGPTQNVCFDGNYQHNGARHDTPCCMTDELETLLTQHFLHWSVLLTRIGDLVDALINTGGTKRPPCTVLTLWQLRSTMPSLLIPEMSFFRATAK